MWYDFHKACCFFLSETFKQVEMPDPGSTAVVSCVSSPSLWTFLRVTEGVEMAEARKLAGNVSEESEVTPRRSFSLNIFLHDGDRVNVFVPSCGDDGVTPVMVKITAFTQLRLSISGSGSLCVSGV